MTTIVIHASPPCYAYSTIAKRYQSARMATYPHLIEPTRDRLIRLGFPYVIENVPGAPLQDPLILCGSQFDLTAQWPEVGKCGIRRHRLFESSVLLPDAGPHDHTYRAVPVWGHNQTVFRGRGFDDEPVSVLKKKVMGISWMTPDELNESIPPAYTEFVGRAVLARIERDSSRPLLIDLFCGAGGASMGYHQAGFDVIGVDLNPMPRYPFQFIQADAIEFLDYLLANPTGVLGRPSAVHASPPCQAYSTATAGHRNTGFTYPDLVAPTRDGLIALDLPYVIENVPQAPLRDAVTLCGSQFGLTSYLDGPGLMYLRRHRLFETNWPLADPGPHDHSLMAVTVCGGGPFQATRKKLGVKMPFRVWQEVMGIDWMKVRELSESIPPAYTNYVGTQLLTYMRAEYGLAA